MKKSRFTEEQIAYALRQAEAGTPVGDVCRQRTDRANEITVCNMLHQKIIGVPAISSRPKRAQARLDLIDWIEGFYNANRLHSSINYLSPTSFEKELKAT